MPADWGAAPSRHSAKIVLSLSCLLSVAVMPCQNHQASGPASTAAPLLRGLVAGIQQQHAATHRIDPQAGSRATRVGHASLPGEFGPCQVLDEGQSTGLAVPARWLLPASPGCPELHPCSQACLSRSAGAREITSSATNGSCASIRSDPFRMQDSSPWPAT